MYTSCLHTSGWGCHAKCQSADRGQFGDQYLAQGHFDEVRQSGNQSCNPPVAKQQLYCHHLSSSFTVSVGKNLRLNKCMYLLSEGRVQEAG